MTTAATALASTADLALSALPGLPELKSRLDFQALLQQQGRMLLLDTALPQGALVAERLVMREAVSQPYCLELDALSSSRHLELKRLLGQQITVRLLQPSGAYRPWHGYVASAGQLGADGGLARYRLVVRPWLHLLSLQRDCRVYQDATALDVIAEVFARYQQAHFEVQVTQPLRRRPLCVQYRESDLQFVQRLLAEEGLSYHWRHLDGEAADAADPGAPARHVLVLTDARAEREHLGTLRYTGQHPTATLRGQQDAVTAFTACRRLQPQAVVLGSWDSRAVAGIGASTRSALDLGELPELPVYDGSGAGRYEDRAHAERAAALALQALELQAKRYEGQGSARHLRSGCTFELVEHPLYGALVPQAGSHARDDNRFTVLAVEHHASNNLGAQAAALLKSSALERGSYKCHFHAAPAAAAVVPRHVRKPTAPGAQSATVVGLGGQALTTERDLGVRLQFPWQRGDHPLPGGLPPRANDRGHAPGNERSLAWVRVAMPSAGANWGSAFVPRIGAEVAVAFVEGDIDQPVVVGQLYNGRQLPPFPAGVDAGVNHPGVISGMRSQEVAGAEGGGGGFNEWAIDDASGQLRMRLLATQAMTEVGLGHLIEQQAGSAQRGRWQGAGFVGSTQGWASVRAGRGLLLSTSARPGSYGSAQSTQMDSDEALAQLRAGNALGQRLSQAALASGAHGLHSHDEAQAVQRLADDIDPRQRGAHPGPVNGQPAQRSSDGRSPDGEPVHAFAAPHLLLDTPSALAMASDASIAVFAGEDASVTSQGDLHQAAAATYAAVSGGTSSWYTHAGGLQAKAGAGPVSIRAHTSTLALLADQGITVASTGASVCVDAQTRIELVGGQSALLLDGADITFSCSGTFTVKGAGHAFMGGGSDAAALQALPQGLAGTTPPFIEVTLHNDALVPMAGYPYRIVFASGTQLEGVLDGNGYARHDGVPNESAQVYFGDSLRPASLQPVKALTVTDESLEEDLRKLGLDPATTDLQALVEREAWRTA